MLGSLLWNDSRGGKERDSSHASVWCWLTGVAFECCAAGFPAIQSRSKAWATRDPAVLTILNRQLLGKKTTGQRINLNTKTGVPETVRCDMRFPTIWKKKCWEREGRCWHGPGWLNSARPLPFTQPKFDRKRERRNMHFFYYISLLILGMEDTEGILCHVICG